MPFYRSIEGQPSNSMQVCLWNRRTKQAWVLPHALLLLHRGPAF
jgi:hypothetical protein